MLKRKLKCREKVTQVLGDVKNRPVVAIPIYASTVIGEFWVPKLGKA